MFVVTDLTCTCTPYLLFKVDQLAGSGVRIYSNSGPLLHA